MPLDEFPVSRSAPTVCQRDYYVVRTYVRRQNLAGLVIRFDGDNTWMVNGVETHKQPPEWDDSLAFDEVLQYGGRQTVDYS